MKGTVWTALCAALAVATRDTSMLVVNDPPSLVAKYASTNGTISNRPAMFGIPANGHEAQLTGQVVYVPADDVMGCNPINKADTKWPSGGLVIVVVERGNCTFVTKVQHAQDVGANGCVIFDNMIEDRLPYMAAPPNDPRSKTISIPSMLIHKDDGAAISQALSDGDNVMLTMAWNIPHPDNIVEWNLWTSADDPTAMEFKKNFDEAAHVLGDAAAFQPHYYFQDRPFCVMEDAQSEDQLPCGDKCINSGRYCTFDVRKEGVTGAMVMAENVRQICISQELKKMDKEDNWWNYVENFDRECSATYDVACSERLMESDDVGVTAAAVNKCIADSGTTNMIGPENTLLNAERELRDEQEIWRKSQIVINEVYYQGSLSCPSPIDVTTCGVLAQICLGYKDVSKVPACISSPDCPLGEIKDVCGKCGGKGQFDACGQCNQIDDDSFNSSCLGCDGVPNSGIENDVCGVCGGPGRDACERCYPVGDSRRQDSPDACEAESGFSLPAVIGIIAAVVAVVGVIAAFWIRHRNRALKEDIDALLKQYLPMDGEGNVQ